MIEVASSYGRGCIRGIARYARAHQGWLFWHAARHLEPVHLNELRRWNADGVIARVENKEIASLVKKLALPAVDVRGSEAIPGVLGIYTDERKVVEMASEHLISKGLKNLAFCGFANLDFSLARQEAFLQYVPVESGRKYHLMIPPPRHLAKTGYNISQKKRPSPSSLTRWLSSLPKPVGIIACNDTCAREILDACMAADIKVPYEISVVGVDDDDVICELSYPTLSSVAPNVEKIGFEAAEQLDRMIDGQAVPTKPIYIPPITVAVRESSDMMALTDPVLIEAVRLIRTGIGTGINVKELLSILPVSRSTLERMFTSQLGCTPYDFITRCRIDRVKQLLLDTNYPISRITIMSGFQGAAHMTAAFRIHTGQTPAQYRKTSQ